ncbi:serine hydrolase domain-containing protein [Streptomyces purpureus]|uniref:Penicillin-binding protein n=1 Tax=Streptomyces purpureus TaxID=1951 RepID=A0A918HGD6_9ACTN|nr:serine hydrolase domain-containing protein [Streptomyces purpureus]GGT62632.1 penicillin-binding protein [Streptomyces purpureus]
MTTADLTRLTQAAPGATAVTLAVLHGGQRHVWCHGTPAAGARPTTPATAYEIGSVTKTFTALLLAQLAAQGRVNLHDPIDAHLPRHHRPRTPGGAAITLLHLATHTSGLPRLPPGLLTRALPAYFTNPYAAYSEEEFHRCLPRTRVRHRPGTRLTYSNYGMALLGHTLAHATATPYPALLTETVCRPLGLTATHCGPPPTGQATGHRAGRPLPPFALPALPAAGALRTTAEDLLTYLHALLHPHTTPLTHALLAVQKPRLRAPRSRDHLCLAWNLRHVDGHTLLFHSGATRGFTVFAGFAPRTGTALAALANTGPRLGGRFVQCAYTTLKRLCGS